MDDALYSYSEWSPFAQLKKSLFIFIGQETHKNFNENLCVVLIHWHLFVNI